MLKELLLRKRQESLTKQLNELLEDKNTLFQREAKLENDVINSTEDLTDEEKKVLEEEASDIEAKKEELEAKKEELEKQLEEVNKELEELEDKKKVEPKEPVGERKKNKNIEIRGGNLMNLERRERIKELVQNEENRKFFDEVRSLVLRTEPTTLTGKELLVPEEVLTFINQDIVGYGELIKEVDIIPIKGNARLIFNAGTPKLFWTEKCASLQEVTLGSFKQIELDNYKLGGYVFLCKSFIEDSIIDVADYLIKEFAKAGAIALEDAIVNGKGSGSKEPEGILTALTSDEEVQAKSILDVLTAIGGLNPSAKNIILVVNRATYYKNVLPETFGKDSKGKIVYGLGQTLPDGTKVKISESLQNEKFIIGDFKNYKLGARKEMKFESSDQVRWIEDQIGYKVSGRYDGKVADKSYFKKGAFVLGG